jgi:F0F1-type ATP synthase membrane subunit c/vacuolar-type H+-ATPase subunit K
LNWFFLLIFASTAALFALVLSLMIL